MRGRLPRYIAKPWNDDELVLTLRQVAESDELTRRIAQAMTLDAGTAHDLPIAALLHDIGHIGLSDAVLARPVNRLDRDELRRYRLHPVLGWWTCVLR